MFASHVSILLDISVLHRAAALESIDPQGYLIKSGERLPKSALATLHMYGRAYGRLGNSAQTNRAKQAWSPAEILALRLMQPASSG